MNAISWYSIFVCVSLYAAPTASARPEFPTSEDPIEFAKQVEKFIVLSTERVISIGGPEKRAQETAILQDPKDWETTLARIIGNPDEYGVTCSRIALHVASHLRKKANHPKIVDATKVLFHYEVEQTLDKIQQIKSRGDVPGNIDKVHLHSSIARNLHYGVPEIILMVLEYANSESAAEIETLHEKHTVQSIAAALRQHGSAMHVEESRKLAIKLHDIGRDDVTDDILRTVGRIERNVKRRGEGRDLGKIRDPLAAAGPDSSGTATPEEGRPFALRIITVIGSIVLLAGMGYWLRYRRKAVSGE